MPTWIQALGYFTVGAGALVILFQYILKKFIDRSFTLEQQTRQHQHDLTLKRIDREHGSLSRLDQLRVDSILKAYEALEQYGHVFTDNLSNYRAIGPLRTEARNRLIETSTKTVRVLYLNELTFCREDRSIIKAAIMAIRKLTQETLALPPHDAPVDNEKLRAHYHDVMVKEVQPATQMLEEMFRKTLGVKD